MAGYSCENCGRLAADGDTHCWQCGQPLPGAERPEQSDATGEREDRFALSMLTVYGGLTLVVVLGSWLLLLLLGRQPLVQANSWRPPEGFVAVTDADRSFTLDLPESWHYLDGSDPREAAAFHAWWAEREALQAALMPWDRLADDIEVTFVAVPELEARMPDQLLVVARSHDLSQVTPEEVERATAGTPASLLEAEQVTDHQKSYHYFSFVVPPLQPAERCQSQLVQHPREALLLVVCSPEFSELRQQVPDIRQSFQSLLR